MINQIKQRIDNILKGNTTFEGLKNFTEPVTVAEGSEDNHALTKQQTYTRILQVVGGLGEHQVGNLKSFSAAGRDGEVELRWEDPDDTEEATWGSTLIVRKEGSYPSAPHDGTVVVVNNIRDQYKTTPYRDLGLENNTEYFYTAFPYTTEFVVTINPANRVSATPTAVQFLGVEWNVDADEVNRIDDATSLTVVPAESAGLPITSDFSQFKPWKLRRCLMNDDGTINYYIDEEDHSKIGEVVNTEYTSGDVAVYGGAHGQVMVEMPKFYYKQETLVTPKRHKYWIASDNYAEDGFEIHPAFIRGRSGTVDIEETTLTRTGGDKFQSSWIGLDILLNETTYVIDSVTNEDSLELTTAPGNASGVFFHSVYPNDGEVDYIYVSVFEGNVSSNVMRSISGVQPSTDTNVTTGTIAGFRGYARERGEFWEIQDFVTTAAIQLLYLVEFAHWDSQTQIGKGVVDEDSGSGNMSRNTGGTIALINASGSETGTNGLVSISYRGIENFWGNILKWVDGFNLNSNGQIWWADHGYVSDRFALPYKTTGNAIFRHTTAQWNYPDDIAALSIDWHFMLGNNDGSDSSGMYDGQYTQSASDSSHRVARFGGSWSNSLNAGLASWLLDRDSGSANRAIGSRLVCIPFKTEIH